MTETYTPGPWKVDVTDPDPNWAYTLIRTEDGQTVAQIEHTFAEKGHRGDMNANARLIAAAPTLLQALRVLVESGGDSTDAMQAAVDAIRSVEAP